MALQPLDAAYQQVVVFDLGTETYALDVSCVIEIIRMMQITPVPGAPYYIEGLLNLRNIVFPIVDLRKRFGLPLKATGDYSRIIVVQVSDDDMRIGAIVDGVSEVMMVSPDAIEPAGRVVTSLDAEFIRGVAKVDGKLIAILHPDKLIEHYETDDAGSFGSLD